MVGGANRRDDGSVGINSTNVFAALESLRRKKKSDKEHGSSKNKGSSKNQAKEPEPQVFWAPAPLTVTSWADVDDDDDYYATTAPPQSVWGSSVPQQTKESSVPVEESESEEDGLDEGDEDIEEELDHELEDPFQTETVVKEPPQASLTPKDTERQLSKKELKKKELEELDAVLAELGIANKETGGQDDSHGAAQEKKAEDLNGDGEKKENAPGESKNAKKKKKKDKSTKEVKESQDQHNCPDISNGTDEIAGTEHAEEDTSAIDVKERLKKVASMKKKKSNKEMDGSARAAANEAAARSAKLAAAKKKEKNHYNQQPVR
ncbi:hypothetical protein HHK36_006132 [Tetracentron sinense]|uniref:Uncharacterized protein n=1 Tax=Tetracentron sinense TaxID=13715 RepID=A0A834ZJV6_TETSI|nr:hypothetical protein HHK36_006132 [Tetracentron sinense]